MKNNNSTEISLFECLKADCLQLEQLVNDVILTTDLDMNPREEFSGQCFGFYLENIPLKLILLDGLNSVICIISKMAYT